VRSRVPTVGQWLGGTVAKGKLSMKRGPEVEVVILQAWSIFEWNLKVEGRGLQQEGS
jgi:hypothetical protein